MQILVTGDTFLGSQRLQKAAEKGQVNEIFGHYKEYIKESDLAITNLESPILDEGNPIAKSGPALRASKKALNILKKAGFNLVTLANNHIRDYGNDGLFSTLDACETLGLDYVGAGENLNNAMQTFYFEKGGMKVGIVNVAENEYGNTHGKSPGGHPLNPIENYYCIQEAKKEADTVIVIVHGGHEFYAYPSPRMKATYRFFVDAGADVVVGHHTHWYSGYEIYKNAPIFYSLGNFLFENKRKVDKRWHVGYGVILDLENQGIKFTIMPYKQSMNTLGIHTLNEQEKIDFDAQLVSINNLIQNDRLLEREFTNFCKSKRNLYNHFLEPHASHILHKLQRMGIFPSLWNSSKKRLLRNLIQCEAHRDVVLDHLKQ